MMSASSEDANTSQLVDHCDAESKFSVVIAEDHTFTAHGIASVLRDGGHFTVAGIASNGIEAISLIKAHQPDCAIIDLGLPGANGIEVFAEAKRWSSRTRFVVLTGYVANATFNDLIANGINGLFLKTGDPTEIYQSIKTVCEGSDVVSKDVTNNLEALNEKENLTLRELEVLHAIARGWSNSQIAANLGISPKTVDSHRTTLMRKLDVHSTATLLVRAMREGILDITDSREPPPSTRT